MEVAGVDHKLQEAMLELGRLGTVSQATAIQMSLPLRHGGVGVGGLSLRHHAAYIGS